MRVGTGFDAHRFDDGSAPLVLAGVVVDADRGVAATSDGDVVAHAVADAILGAAALGDLGLHFPSGDPAWRGADSMEILASVSRLASAAGFSLTGLDATIVAESVRVAPHRDAMRSKLAAVLGLDLAAVSVKATSTDGMGAIGADEGIAVLAVVTMS